jgi:hypothetical protein
MNSVCFHYSPLWHFHCEYIVQIFTIHYLRRTAAHLKCSQADFFDCDLPTAISYRQLPSLRWTGCCYIDSARNQQKIDFIVGEASLPSRFLAIELYSCSADHVENTSTVLLTVRGCWTIYRAIAWQHPSQINYNLVLFAYWSSKSQYIILLYEYYVTLLYKLSNVSAYTEL